MPHDLWHNKENYGPRTREARCLFTTAGTGAVTVQENKGFASIARSGVGTFLLTLRHAPQGAYYIVNVSKQFSTDAQNIVISAQDGTAKTVTLLTVTAATANTAVDTTGMLIHVTVQVRLAA